MTHNYSKAYPLLDETDHPHACILFDNIEHYRRVASRYILDGLLDNDKCLMAVDSYQKAHIAEDFSTLGYKIDDFISEGSLTIIDVKASYSENGGFDPDKTLPLWIEQTKQAVSEGYQALRVVGEATFAIGNQDLFDKLIRYENIINKDLFPHFPFKSLCVYDKELYPPEVIKAAIQAHPILFYNDELFLQNIHYIPPEIHFQPDSASQELEIWLDNVRKNNENLKALSEREAKFRNMFEKAPMSYQSLDEHGNFLEINDLWIKTLGYDRDEVIGRNFSEFLQPQWREHFRHNFPRFKAVGEILGVEFEMLKKDGSAILVSFHGKIGRNDRNEFQRTHCVFNDITEARRLESKALQQQRIITLNSRIATSFLQADGDTIFLELLKHILEMTESAYGYVGYIDENGDLICPTMTRDIWPQCTIDNKDIVFPKESWDGLWGRSLKQQKTLYASANLNTPDGHVPLKSALAVPIIYRDVMVGQYVVANKEGGYDEHDRALLESAATQTAPLLYGVLQDQRLERDKAILEQQYIQAQKMESIGRLAGGVAHDLNNLLGPILGYGEMLIDDTVATDPRREALVQIVEAGNRASDLVRQLLTFSRKQNVNLKHLSLNDVLGSFEKLLRRTIRADIDLQIHLAEDLPVILGDTGQIEQIIMNLAVNAQDAMSSGGRLVFETSVDQINYARSTIQEDITPGRYVILRVTDNGIGMEKEILEKMFEPFFTTKERHKGTGLGMATVYGIVQQHKGHIQVLSTPLEGTQFTLFFPALDEEQENIVRRRETLQTRRGNETILLVEDSEQLLAMTEKILKRNGYKVITATNGIEALKVARSFDGKIDLLLTDVVMPAMNGDQLVAEMEKLSPGLPVLLMSGYADEFLTSQQMTIAGLQFIQKPYSIPVLLNKIRDILNKHKSHQ